MDFIIDAFSRAQKVWETLKSRWHDLHLPGSCFSPDEFLIGLTLSQIAGTPEEIAERVRAAEPAAEQLRRGGMSNADIHMLSTIALLQKSAPPAEEAPAPAVPIVDSVPTMSTAPPDESAAKSAADGEQAATGCCHVGSDGKCTACTSEETSSCDDCDEDIVWSRAQECKNKKCGHAYCDDCATRNLNEHEYCDDCATIQCSEPECNEDIDRGSGTKCSNPECPDKDCEFCGECAAKIFNDAGLCSKCSDEEEYTCDGCKHSVTFSKVMLCKNFEECDRSYCKECAPENLTDGVCDDCATVECSTCRNRITLGKEVKCANPGCTRDNVYCGTCASMLLNEAGLCNACSNEMNVVCTYCQRDFTESRTVMCTNFEICRTAYCAAHTHLVDGLCRSCSRTPGKPPAKRSLWLRIRGG
jgi:hypothetical protein